MNDTPPPNLGIRLTEAPVPPRPSTLDKVLLWFWTFLDLKGEEDDKYR